MTARSDCFSPSAEKPGRVVASWQSMGLAVELREPAPVSREQLSLVHDPDYVAGILTGRLVNGFRNRSAEVAASLPWTVGAMLSAARHALATSGAAVAPCSGFHHAGFDSGGGFCTFNGLMVTAAVLKQEGLVARVGIIDCDMHYGDGTADIIEVSGARRWVRHFSSGAEFYERADADRFFTRLEAVIERMRECDLVLYQAGADPHVDDPLGGFLTTEELRLRDAMVFQGLRQLGVPVAWNLAGGYQVEPDGSIPNVLEIHANTAVECIEA